MNYDREGGDITASDMVEPYEEPSEIVEFYKDSTVLITGATGFLGKLFLEKILRSSEVNKIYILARPKKGKDAQKRLEEICEGPCFEPLRRKKPNFLQKVHIVNGDLTEPNLGFNEEDIAKLKEEVTCVIHCAATVRFDEKIRIATNINIRSVRDLLKLAKQMKNLKSMLCVSTAYSNCTRKDIDEKFYEPPMTADQLITLVDCLDDDKLMAITPSLLGDYPNTYVLTKAIAESVVQAEGKHLPVALFRPSIVIGSVKEPVAGFIDNMYGATGVLLGAATGLLRSLHGRKENKADMVPVDYVINSGLAVTWDIANMKSLNNNLEVEDDQDEINFNNEVPIYNFVSTPERPITWEMFEMLTKKHATQVPSELCVWHYFFALRASLFWHNVAIFFLHTIPGYLVDFLAICIGKKPMLVKGYEKINKFTEVIGYFSSREWKFNNDNVQKLWKKMKKPDQDQFEFSMKRVDWDAYFYTYTRGARVYLLKDPLETVPRGKVKYYKLLVAHYALLAVLGGIGLWLVSSILKVILGYVF